MIFLTLKMNSKRGMKLRLLMNLAIILFQMETNYQLISQNLEKNTQLKENQSDSSNLVLLKNNRALGIEKMNSKEIYSIIISSKVNIPTSRTYFEKKFPLYNFQWKDIYTLSRKVTINACLRGLC